MADIQSIALIILLIIGFVFALSWILTGMRISTVFLSTAIFYFATLLYLSKGYYKEAVGLGIFFIGISQLYIYEFIIHNEATKNGRR